MPGPTLATNDAIDSFDDEATRRNTSRRYKLPPMKSNRGVSIIVLVSVVLIVACGKDAGKRSSAPSPDSSLTSAASRPVSRNTGWDEAAAGNFIVLAASDDMIDAALVLPQETDSSLSNAGTPALSFFANKSVDLFDAAGAAGTSALAINPQQQPNEGCVVWPSVRLTAKPAKSWKVGFESGRATSIPMDSIGGMSSADSSSITIELARVASAATIGGDPAFQGLPFTVRKAYRMQLGDTAVLIGSVVRKINEEANPREEHLLLVAERSGTAGKYLLGFQSRSAGAEDVIRTNTVLAALRFVRTKRPAIVFSFEYDDGGQVALLQRLSDHDWKISWRSAYTGC